jgi:hypothetical protein
VSLDRTSCRHHIVDAVRKIAVSGATASADLLAVDVPASAG